MIIRYKTLSSYLLVALISSISLTLLSAQNVAAATQKIDKKWVPKKLPDGQPDVQGFYRPEKQGTFSLTFPSNGGQGEVLRNKRLLSEGKPIPSWPSRIIDPADGQIPYQPWARAKQKDIEANIDWATKPEHIDGQQRCFPDGAIRSPLWTGFEIQQFPGYVVITFEQNHNYRVIPLDNRSHIPENIKLWMSDSRGHWEGNTLVVDVTNSNSKHRFTNIGDFASENVHITERFKFVDENAYEYTATITDPTVYTRPWTIFSRYVRSHLDEPGWENWEQPCQEYERNSAESLLHESVVPNKQ